MSASADGRTNTRGTVSDHATQNSGLGAQLELRSKLDPRLGPRRGLQDVREGSQDANLGQPPARDRQRSRPTRTLRIRSSRRPRACRNREVDSELAEPQLCLSRPPTDCSSTVLRHLDLSTQLDAAVLLAGTTTQVLAVPREPRSKAVD